MDDPRMTSDRVVLVARTGDRAGIPAWNLNCPYRSVGHRCIMGSIPKLGPMPSAPKGGLGEPKDALLPGQWGKQGRAHLLGRRGDQAGQGWMKGDDEVERMGSPPRRPRWRCRPTMLAQATDPTSSAIVAPSMAQADPAMRDDAQSKPGRLPALEAAQGVHAVGQSPATQHQRGAQARCPWRARPHSCRPDSPTSSRKGDCPGTHRPNHRFGRTPQGMSTACCSPWMSDG